MESYTTIKKQLLKNKKVKRAYDELGPEFALVQALIDKRIQRGFTQAALARRIGTKQSAISRLERGGANPTINFLKKVASALNTSVSIQLR